MRKIVNRKSFFILLNILLVSLLVFGDEPKSEDNKLLTYYQFPIRGIVFEDNNDNNKRDVGEKFLENIPVSDGKTIVLTDKAGTFFLKNEDKSAKFVFVSIPNGYEKNANFYRLLVDEKEELSIEFGLKKLVNASEKNFSFVQITDIHVNNEGDANEFKKALKEISEIDIKPDFIIATGDLVGKGDDRFSFYQKAVKENDIPIFNVLGNHDISKEADKMLNYNKYFGPDYYSFNHGKFHFLILNTLDKSDDQKNWMKQDIEKLAEGKKILVFQHYPPDKDMLDEYKKYGIDAFFTGHWHSSKLFTYKDIKYINSPPLLFGGIDFSPSGFRVVNIKNDEFISEYLPNGVKEFLNIVSPQGNDIIHINQGFQVCVNAYDSQRGVKKIDAEITGENFKKKIKLYQKSSLNWLSKKRIIDLKEGKYEINISAQIKDNIITKTSKFEIVKPSKFTKPIQSSKSNWEYFMGDAKHTGIAKSSLLPPLNLIWIHPSGASADLASPIVANGKVFAAVKERSEKKSIGLLALNGLTGEKIWFAETQSQINHTPIHYEGLVIAQTVCGRVLAYNSLSGKEKWHYDCGDDISRWLYSAPTISNKKLYVGNSKWFAALEPATGVEFWRNRDGTDWISCFSSPAVSDDLVLNGGIWLQINDKWHCLYAMENRTGKIQWAAEGIGYQGSPTIVGDKIYCNDIQGRFLILDLKTGQKLWEYFMIPKGNNWSSVTPAVKENIVITGSSDGTVFAFDVEKKEKLWEFKSGESIFRCSAYNTDYRSLLSSPTISGDIVYLGSGDGKLYALDIKNGEKKWEFNFGVPVLSTPAVVDNWLYICTYDGNIYGFYKFESE